MAEIENPSVFAMGNPLPESFNQYVSGKAYAKKLLATPDVAIFNLTFAPSCRNSWHIHHKRGQVLLVTGGYGWYQEWGKAPQALKPGDVVNIAPEVKHWHGATGDSWFSHVAIGFPDETATTEWLEPVDDAHYCQVEIMWGK